MITVVVEVVHPGGKKGQLPPVEIDIPNEWAAIHIAMSKARSDGYRVRGAHVVPAQNA